jgi:gamma-glutamylcyclotransferase
MSKKYLTSPGAGVGQLYFAYGSNMNRQQMEDRCQGHLLSTHGTAVVFGHALSFTGHSKKWGGGVATIRSSSVELRDWELLEPEPLDYVEGVVYMLSQEGLKILDRYEGSAYKKKKVRLAASYALWESYGPDPLAWTYVQEVQVPTIPSKKYFELLEKEYRAHNFNEGILERARAEAVEIQGEIS